MTVVAIGKVPMLVRQGYVTVPMIMRLVVAHIEVMDMLVVLVMNMSVAVL